MEARKSPCMLQFQSDVKLTSEEFVKVFKEFDKDGNGYIEADELNSFMITLLQETGNEKPSQGEVETFKEYILEKFDDNSDAKISMCEDLRAEVALADGLYNLATTKRDLHLA